MSWKQLQTCTAQLAAITPSTGLSENGSNVLSGRRMKSGFSKYLQLNRSQMQQRQTKMCYKWQV